MSTGPAVLAAISFLVTAALHAQPAPTPAAAPASSTPTPAALMVERTIAVVDKRIITARDANLFAFEQRLMNRDLEAIDDESLRRELLSDIVDEALLADWAAPIVTNPSDEDVRALGREQFARYERWAGSPDRLRSRIADAGLTESQVRLFAEERARTMYLIRIALAREAGAEALPPDARDPAKATRLRLAHIFFSIPAERRDPDAESVANERALAVRRELAGGLAFDRAALMYSDDQATARRGGDLGWLDRATLDPALSEAVLRLKPGETTPPVKSGNGYHIVRLTDIDSEGSRLFTDRYRAIEERELRRLRAERDVRLAEGYRLRPLDPPSPTATPAPSR